MPGVSKKAFLEHKRWAETKTKDVPLSSIRYFELTPYAPIWNELNKFKIKLLNQYTIKDFYGKNHIRSSIKTNIWNYSMWDEEYSKYITRYDSYKKYEEIEYQGKNSRDPGNTLDSWFVQHCDRICGQLLFFLPCRFSSLGKRTLNSVDSVYQVTLIIVLKRAYAFDW